jgi:GDPmannose 4,6-dehydratase
MPTALITGITGQDGLYLAELLLGKGYEVVGLVHGHENPKSTEVAAIVPDVRLVHGDLTDLPSLLRALRESEPDEVYNLAAMSRVAHSWDQAALTADVTAKGVLNLLDAIRLYCGPDAGQVRFYQASSSEMFGKSTQVPQTEATPVAPRSPYGVAKVFAHYMTINYRESYGLHASCGILFNHESPRRGADFVTRKVSRGVSAIKLGVQDKLMMGNLDARRDWGFAGDYVDAMWRMVQQPTGDDYIVATGVAHSIRELLGAAFDAVGIDDWERYVEQDKQFLRPADIDLVVGDASKARELLDWKPTVQFAQLVGMLVEHDLQALRDQLG